MAKKKKTPKPSSETKRNLVRFLKSKEFTVIRALFYIVLSLLATVSIISYFISRGSSNICGSVGNWLAELLVKDTFGVASLGLCFLLFIYACRRLGKNLLPWGRTLVATLFWMVWISCTIGMIFINSENLATYAGTFGFYISRWFYKIINFFYPILLVFALFAFLYGFHHVKFKMPSFARKKDEDEAESIDYGDEVIDEQKKEGLVTRLLGLFKKKNDADNEDDDKPSSVRKPQQSSSEHTGTTDNHAPSAESHRDQPAQQDEVEQREEKPIHDTNDNHQPDAANTTKPVENDSVQFNIDDRFVQVNERAQRGNDNGEPSFNIIDNTEQEPENETADEQEKEQVNDTQLHHIGLDEPYDPKLDLKNYHMPDTSFLVDWEQKNVKVSKDELIANKDRIVQTLRDYGIDIVEITASPGPTVTLYEIKPAPGVRISKIKGLEDDIALSLSALGIRIIAPIPGKGTVGIEVPNANPQIVSMKTMLTSEAFLNASKMELPIAFGKTISNDTYVTDLAKMPHLLMAGATGTGKSVGLNAVIASLLYKKHPSELKFVMVDPKKVELSLYNKIENHYLAKLPDSDEAIITDVKKVVRTLNSLCIEMDQRYDLLKQAQVRKITEYNKKFINRQLNPNNGHRYLPYIVLVIDEFADLIMTAGKEIETPICRLAQLARAVGIHLIIATQRPTTNIITGTIKANFPARIAFRVTSAIDSRTILDCGGANQLIGRGDMLISLSGSELVRCQCALIETEEIENLVKQISEQDGYPEGQGFQLPEYLDENEEPNKDFDPKQKDELFNDAARLVVASQFGSTSLLQRKLSLGYNRAGRIIDQLEAAGIVGAYNGAKPREVLIHDETELEELLRSL